MLFTAAKTSSKTLQAGSCHHSTPFQAEIAGAQPKSLVRSRLRVVGCRATLVNAWPTKIYGSSPDLCRPIRSARGLRRCWRHGCRPKGCRRSCKSSPSRARPTELAVAWPGRTECYGACRTPEQAQPWLSHAPLTQPAPALGVLSRGGSATRPRGSSGTRPCRSGAPHSQPRAGEAKGALGHACHRKSGFEHHSSACCRPPLPKGLPPASTSRTTYPGASTWCFTHV